MIEIRVNAPEDIVLREMKAMIDLSVVTVDPNHGVGHYEDHLGYQIIGHVSSDGFKVIRRFREGYRVSQMISNWDPGSYGGLYGPTMQGRVLVVEGETLLLAEFKRNPSFWMPTVLITMLGSIACGISAAVDLLQGTFSYWNVIVPFGFASMFLIGNLPMAFDTESEDRQALLEWINGIKARAEKAATPDLPLHGQDVSKDQST